MKLTFTITTEEKDKVFESIMFDPCIHIECSGICCNNCPLQSVAEALRRAQEDYVRAINKIAIEGE